ncbi:MAG TPA: carboxypeptidase regulatory-like domain-containing protein [Bryobacteraceae bacterium]|nr:carboxypeptidase regulatory-like domain-containing protein [Bryobacteraceae bacterium]
MLRIYAALLLTAFNVYAQTVTGTLEGRVSDPAGAAIPAASVRIKEISTGATRSSQTNAEGSFQIPYLPLGTYEVTVESPGLQSQTARAAVELNRTTVLNITLAVAGTQQTITVTDAAPIVDVTSGQIRRSVSEELIETLPIAGRDFKQLFRIIPGFQTNPTGGQDNFTLSSGSSASFNGTGTRSATFQTDGIANDDNSENQNRQGVNISTIKEFQVLTNNFSAEFGRGAGAVVLVQTKSGTNEFHGEAYWQLTNSALNARSYFANAAGSRIDPVTGARTPNVPTTSAKTHRPGGVIGGPIIPDKLFFFGSYEKFWAPGSTNVTVSLIQPEFRTTNVDPTLPDAAARRAWVQSVIDRYPNVAPNNTVTNPYGYTASVERTDNRRDVTGRLDYNIGERDLVYGRYQWGDTLLQTGEIVRGTNAMQDHVFQNAGITWTHVFSPRLSGEARVGFGRRNMLVGLVDGENVPIVSFTGANTPTNIGNAGQYPLFRVQNDFQYVYNLAFNAGKHNLRFGTDTRRYQLNEQIEQTHRGQWTFRADGPYSTVENFVRGVVQTYQQGFGPKYNGYRTTEVNLYFQDQYRVTSTFSLDLGARFEHVGRPKEVNNLVDLLYGSDTYIEPRIGFAYSPGWQGGWLGKLTGGPGATVVRGGYGIFHGRIFQSIFAQGGVTVRFNPPQGATVTFADPNMSVANPLGGYVFQPGPPTGQVTLVAPDPGLHNPYTQQWNLTFERAMPLQSGLSISYIGNRGIGFIQYDARNRAQLPVTSTVPLSYAGTNFTGVLFDRVDANLFNTNPAPGFISLSQPRTNARRSDGRYGAIFGISNNAWSYYNALQAVWVKRLTHGFSGQLAYTWSKNIDTGSEATFVGTGDTNFLISDRLGPAGNRGPSRLDQPQRFVASYTYQFPFRKGQQGWIGRMIGGWEMNGIATLASGNPVTVVLGYDLNADGIGGDRPYLVDPSVLFRSMDNARVNPATGRQYSMDQVPTSAFFPNANNVVNRDYPFLPGTGAVGSLGRNTFRLHGQKNFDIVFVKNTRLFGRDRGHELQFRAEVYNIFNRTQFGVPNLTLIDTSVAGYRINPNFGQISALNNIPRNMQMMLRYQF